MSSNFRHRISDLPSVGVRRPVLMVVVSLLIVLGGVAALLGVEVRELPNVDRPVVSVNFDYPGAAPETMDAEVTSVLEAAASRVPGVVSIRSASEENNGRIRVEFEQSADLTDAANDVREAVNEVRDRLPDGVESIVVFKADADAEPIVRLAVRSDTLSVTELTAMAEDQVVPALLNIDGVADARVFGNQRRVLYVVVDPLRLSSYGLSVADVAASLRTANLDVPAGSIGAAEQELLVRTEASVVEEGALERIVIRGTTRVADVASVYYGPAEALNYAQYNGQRVIGVGVIRQARSNTIEISDAVARTVEALNRRLPDLEIVTTADDAIFVRGAITEVLRTLLIGVGIVVLVIFLFIGSFRATIVPAVAIPVALVGTLAAIWLLGFSVNLLTLLALVLATGLVVDDAIVVLENVQRIRRTGVRPMAAAVLGTRQVFFAVIATSTTLASVFIPIAFLPGTTGALFTEFGFVLAVSVGISSFVALGVCPMLASRLPETAGGSALATRLRKPLTAFGGFALRAYERSLAVALQAPLLGVGLMMGASAAVGALYLTLDQELVPPEDRGVLVLYLRGPDGVNLDYTARQVARVEALLDPLVERGEVEGYLSIVGRFDLAVGWIVAPLTPWEQRERGQHEIARSLAPGLAQIPGVRVQIRHPNSLSIRSAGSEMEFALTGADYGRIAAAGEPFVAAMRERIPYLQEPRMEYAATQPQLSLRLNRERAAELGVDVSVLDMTLRAMVDGYEVIELNVGDKAVPIRIHSARGSVDDTDDLHNLFLPTADGQLISLAALVEVTEGGIAAELDRRGQRRAVEVEADLADGYTVVEASEALLALASERLPPDVNLLLLGEAEAVQEAVRDALITFAIAMVVVLLVLAAQFESFPSAFAVLLTVPLGLAAAVFSLWLTGTSLNIYSQIGLIMLIGLMAKNGILIVEFADQLRDMGYSVRSAAHRAATIRLRPVMMTMLSTSLGALPLLISGGPGAEARSAIGWVIFGGLVFAILATVYLTPLTYCLMAPLASSRGTLGRRLDEQLDEAAASVVLEERHAVHEADAESKRDVAD